MKEVLDIFDDLFQAVLEETGKLSLDSKDVKAVHVAAYHSTIIESVKSIICLSVVCGSATTIPSIFRGILEIFVSQKNLVEQDDYIQSLRIDSLDYKKKMLVKLIAGKEAGKSCNPFLKGAVDSGMNFEIELSKVKEQIKEAKIGGGRLLNIWDKFKLADMQDEYNALYTTMCVHSHHHISELERRHIVKGSRGISFKILEKPTLKELASILDSTADILVRSLENTSSVSQGEAATRKAHEILNKLHETISRGIGDE